MILHLVAVLRGHLAALCGHQEEIGGPLPDEYGANLPRLGGDSKKNGQPTRSGMISHLAAVLRCHRVDNGVPPQGEHGVRQSHLSGELKKSLLRSPLQNWLLLMMWPEPGPYWNQS